MLSSKKKNPHLTMFYVLLQNINFCDEAAYIYWDIILCSPN